MRPIPLIITAALFISLLSTNGFAKPPIPLTDCGTITQRGNYILENDLVFTLGTGNGSCLVINSSHVNVDLNGRAITCIYSPGFPIPCGVDFGEIPLGGIGIEIEADHVSIANGQVGKDDFEVGIFGEGDHISATNLGIATATAIVLNDVSYSAFTDIVFQETVPTEGCCESGPPVLSVSGGGNNTFTSINTLHETGSGFIFTNSSNNVINGANIACSSASVAGPGILLTQDSNNNFVTNTNIFVLFGNGIELDLGSDNNVVQNNTVETATSSGGFFAMADQNPDCGSNVWTDNTFSNIFLPGETSASPASCIH
jgi:hypothetical protein